MEYFSNKKISQVSLSIIIPMYNVEEYIIETLNSMRSVDSDEVELILIDDGSTDCTLTLAKEWAEKNNKFDTLIISKNNSGPSIARNIGLSEARGELVTFFDSDDIALSYLYREVIQIMLSHEVDICQFRGASFDHLTQNIYEFPDHYVWNDILKGQNFKVLTPQQEPRLARLEPSAVVRVYRKDFITKNEIYFPEGLFFEDLYFHTKCILSASKIALLDKTLLLYRVHREGQTTGSFGKKRFDILKINELIIKEVRSNKIPDSVLANIIGLVIIMNIWCAENCAYENKPDFLNKTLALFSEIPKEIFDIYKDKYSHSDWERKIFRAFVERNKIVLNHIAEGGYPVFEEDDYSSVHDVNISLASIDGKIEHLFSQQKDGWAHDRFNALNGKIQILIDQNAELIKKVESEKNIISNLLFKIKRNLTKKIKG